jgi:hypothetical protein
VVGWRAPVFGWLLVGLCLASAPVGAQRPGAEDAEADAESQPGTPSADETGVSMEFLEFLGTWESNDGEWVDPTELQSADWPASVDETSDTGTGDAN